MYDESKIIELLQRRIIEEWDIKIKSDTIYNSYENYSLAAGLPGVILLLSEINYDEYKDQIDNYLIYIVKILSNNGIVSSSLYSGAAGLALSLLHLANKDKKYSDLINSIDNYICYSIEDTIHQIDADTLSPLNYDIIEGISGILVYLLIKDDEKFNDIISDIINKLIDLFVNNHGLPPYYVKSQNQLSIIESEIFPNGCLNLGVAHGLAGVGIMVAIACIKGFTNSKTKKFLKNIIEIYDRSEIADGTNQYKWKSAIDMDEYSKGSDLDNKEYFRDAWCYGSPGISLLYLYVGIFLKDQKLVEKSKNILIASLECPVGVQSSILCHGYSGLYEIGFLYKQIFKEEPWDRYLSIIKEKILSSFTISKKFGFEEDSYYSDGNEGSVKFLDGSLGIVLTLLHIQNKYVKTYWREALLIFDNLTIEN